MTQEQTIVTQWWHSGRDYVQGVALLGKFSKNKVLLHTLNRPGKERFGGRKKLEYELTKAVGLEWRKMPKQQQPYNPTPTLPKGERVRTPKVTEVEKEKDEFELTISGKPLDQFPKIIRRIKYEYSEKYKQRSMLHKQMREVPAPNTDGNCTKRAGLLAEIKAFSAEMDFLHEFINEYERKGTLPIEEEVWPKAKEEKPVELPADIAELKKMKKNLQTSNTKHRNVLLYGQKTKADKEHPMPQGPKRARIELQIAERDRQIEAIEKKIFEMETK